MWMINYFNVYLFYKIATQLFLIHRGNAKKMVGLFKGHCHLSTYRISIFTGELLCIKHDVEMKTTEYVSFDVI